MKYTRPRALRASATALAVAGLLLSSNVYAGRITNSNEDQPGRFLGECGAVAQNDRTACVGALNLGNVDVEGVAANGASLPGFTFDEGTGVYSTLTPGESFVSSIKTALGDLMAKLTGKIYPVGEPVGIKAVNNDTAVKNGKPANCLINTSFLSPEDTGDATTAYLDSLHPKPVVCSSPFQTHKRFKIAMQPATVDLVANGAESDKPIDLVFNVADGDGLQPYQVFSKINNYTGKRLKGYKIVVGRGTESSFQSASELNIADKLHISLGIGEGATSAGVPDGTNLFDAEEGLATFSHGLFGAPDKHFDTNGFFDDTTAGFNVVQGCATPGFCGTYPNPGFPTGAPLYESDTIYSTSVLTSNYTTLFGDWLPSTMQPKGIFFDFDSDPTTDADLVAWWDGTNWRKNNDSGFAIVSPTEFNTWANDARYAIDDIEDVLNLGINYIVKVGDGIGGDFTIRIIPIVAVDQDPPSFVGTTPTPLVATTPTPAASSSSGGCTTAHGQSPFDPTLPLLAAAGLIGLGLRRARRN